MLRGSLVFLFVLFIFLDLNAQVIDANVNIEGFITNRDGKYIESVHVVNISRQWGTTSSREGQFHINALPGDTIRYTCVGYVQHKYFVPADRQSPVIPLHIVMQVDTIQMSAVEIFPWPSDADALKKAILAMDDQTPQVPDLKLNDPKYNAAELPYRGPQINIPGMGNPGLTYTIKGPFSAMYDAFSKEAKSRRILASLVNQDQKKVVAARRYNAEVVKRVTAFKTDKEIQDFMLYCNLSVDFIVSSTEYDLYKAIHDCLLAYNEEKQSRL